MRKMIDKKIQQIFNIVPEVIYGYTNISYSLFSEKYKSALMLAVPYEEQLTLDNYTEEKFEKSIVVLEITSWIRCQVEIPVIISGSFLCGVDNEK